MPKLLINLTTANNDPDKTTVAFVVANAGIAAGQEVVIFLNVEAVRLAIAGYADQITSAGFKPVKDLLLTFTENGGKLWVCPPCFHARELNSEQVVPGAIFAGGAAVVELLGQGAASVSY